MRKIHLLDQNTINKIAAGEVVERPLSIVKELVENSIDAGSTAITVEIKEGGVKLIRITDNGCGISEDDVDNAFVRHSTSKIQQIEDLESLHSLGFRGEALASISAVSMVEMITKTEESMTGIRCLYEGGGRKTLEEIGCPEGTTMMIKNLFYNVPARKKFLKTPATEGSYISELMNRLALSHPEISFKYIVNGQVKLHTTGNHNLKDCIMNVYNKDIARNVLKINSENHMFKVDGYIGRPTISRGNRSYETYFVNGRYVKSNVIQKAIEDAYKSRITLHQYPFVVLNIKIDASKVDVNVHPNKMQVRFDEEKLMYSFILEEVKKVLEETELIHEVSFSKKVAEKKVYSKDLPEPFEKKRIEEERNKTTEYGKTKAYVGSEKKMQPVGYSGTVKDDGFREKDAGYNSEVYVNGEENAKDRSGDSYKKNNERPRGEKNAVEHRVKDNSYKESNPVESNDVKGNDVKSNDVKGNDVKSNDVKGIDVEDNDVKSNDAKENDVENNYLEYSDVKNNRIENNDIESNHVKDEDAKSNCIESNYPQQAYGEEKTAVDTPLKDIAPEKTMPVTGEQLNLKETLFIDEESVADHKVIGQLFDTYWIVELKNKYYVIDQHAAHERILYEKIIASLEDKIEYQQGLLYPKAIQLSPNELNRYTEHRQLFEQLGFEIDEFGDDSIVVRAVPYVFQHTISEDDFLDILDQLEDEINPNKYDFILHEVAMMACKAAIKANDKMTVSEYHQMLTDLLKLENPFNCPHGRPTIISMTKYELEKKFKRII